MQTVVSLAVRRRVSVVMAALAVMAFGLVGYNRLALELFPDITYSFYPVWCDLYGVAYRKVPLADDFSVDPGAYLEEHGGIIVPQQSQHAGFVIDRLHVVRVQPDGLIKVDDGLLVIF